MGTYAKSNFGQINGKVGNAVAGKWRGVDYLRSLPAKRTRAATPKQLEVYARLALSAVTLSPIKDILNIGFGDKKLRSISGYNAAVKNFIAKTINGIYPDFTVDYPNMQLSKGGFGKLFNLSVEYNGNLAIGWTVITDNRTAFMDDDVLVVVFNETTNMYLVNESAKRGDAVVEIDIASNAGDVVHAWAFCIKRETQAISESQYVGTVTLP